MFLLYEVEFMESKSVGIPFCLEGCLVLSGEGLEIVDFSFAEFFANS